MTKLANIISGILHPIFMPLYGLVLIFLFNPYISLQVQYVTQIQVLLLMFSWTVITPIFIMILLKKVKVIKNFYLENHQERKWPFIGTIVCYYLCLESINWASMHLIFDLLIIGAIIILLIAHLVTLKWKISAHMIGIGGLTGVMIGLSQRFSIDHFWIILFLILTSGLIGFARLKIKAHTYQQVYAGFILGLFIQWSIIVLF